MTRPDPARFGPPVRRSRSPGGGSASVEIASVSSSTGRETLHADRVRPPLRRRSLRRDRPSRLLPVRGAAGAARSRALHRALEPGARDPPLRPRALAPPPAGDVGGETVRADVAGRAVAGG